MGKITQTIVNSFTRGMTNDPRHEDKRFSRLIKHYDCLSARNKLIPHRSHEADGSTGDTEKLVKFVSLNDKHYALGVVSGNLRPNIFERASLPAGAWSQSGGTFGVDAGDRSENLFIPYQGLIFGARGGTAIWQWSYTAGGAYTQTQQALTYTDIGQGLVHSKDERLYIPYYTTDGSGNFIPKIAKFNSSFAFTAAALTLPANNIIVDLCEYGNYLAIATRPRYEGGRSTVYLWNRDDSLETLSEEVDWGTDNLHIIEQMDGFLIGISSSDVSALNFAPKLVFRQMVGVGAKKFLELTVGPTTSQVQYGGKQKANDRLYFMMSVEIDGVQLDGVWTLGAAESGAFALSLDRLLNNDTAITSCVPKGFHLLGDYMTVAYTESSTYTIKRTNNDTAFSASSIYESEIFNDGDSSLTKKLLSVSVSTEYLPADGQIVLKYKKDEETSFTTIFTHGTDNSISHTAINIESTGATLPEFKEITFRIESTGKAVVTGLKMKTEIIDKDIA